MSLKKIAKKIEEWLIMAIKLHGCVFALILHHHILIYRIL
jgi:hypothetical protein